MTEAEFTLVVAGTAMTLFFALMGLFFFRMGKKESHSEEKPRETEAQKPSCLPEGLGNYRKAARLSHGEIVQIEAASRKKAEFEKVFFQKD